jgi:nucleoid-associated protein YgaU
MPQGQISLETQHAAPPPSQFQGGQTPSQGFEQWAQNRNAPAPEPEASQNFGGASGFDGNRDRREPRNYSRSNDLRDSRYQPPAPTPEPVRGLFESSHDRRDGSNRDFDALDAGGQTYTVEPNDNFWTISKKVYGTVRYFQALARVNGRSAPDPTLLMPGMAIRTPPAKVLEARFPELIPAPPGSAVVPASACGPAGLYRGETGQPIYRVGRGDTLTGIAQAHLGRSSRWIQIYHLNRQQLADPQKLVVGTELVMPADASRVRLVDGITDDR